VQRRRSSAKAARVEPLIVPTLVAERVSNAALSALFDSLMQRRLNPTRVILKRAIQRGELPADTDLELAVEAVTGAAILRVYFLPTDLSAKAMRKLFIVQLRGLRARLLSLRTAVKLSAPSRPDGRKS
jgi:hypothetical protein